MAARDELHYRRQKENSDQMWWMTAMITVLTIANVAFVGYEVFW